MSDDEMRKWGIAPLVEFTDVAIVPPPGFRRRLRRPGIRLPLRWWLGIGASIAAALVIGFVAGLLWSR